MSDETLPRRSRSVDAIDRLMNEALMGTNDATELRRLWNLKISTKLRLSEVADHDHLESVARFELGRLRKAVRRVA